MSQSLLYDEIKFIGKASVSRKGCDENVKFEDILNTQDDSDVEFFVEGDSKNPDEIKQKTISFPFFSLEKIVLDTNLVNK